MQATAPPANHSPWQFLRLLRRREVVATTVRRNCLSPSCRLLWQVLRLQEQQSPLPLAAVCRTHSIAPIAETLLLSPQAQLLAGCSRFQRSLATTHTGSSSAPARQIQPCLPRDRACFLVMRVWHHFRDGLRSVALVFRTCWPKLFFKAWDPAPSSLPTERTITGSSVLRSREPAALD